MVKRKRISWLSWLLTYTLLGMMIILPSSSEAAIGRIVKNGDVVLGGLFPVHIENVATGTLCNVTTEKGAIWARAMMYAIDSINNSTELLPNIKLGYDIRDTCHNLRRAITASMEFVDHQHENLDITVSTYLNSSDGALVMRNNFDILSSTVKTKLPPISGVIGGSSSHISMAVADLLQFYCLPVISYSSTSRLLSDKVRYSSFLRTVPSDVQQARAIAELVRYFNWSYVSTVAVDTAYGRQGIQLFHKAAAELGICISPVAELFSPANPSLQIPAIVTRLKQDSNSTVIVFYSDEFNAQLLLSEAEKQNLVGRTWIASESWGDSRFTTRLRSDVIGGMLGVIPQNNRMNYFRDYLKQFIPPNPKTSPWLYQYLHDRYTIENESHAAEPNHASNVQFNVRDLPTGKSQNVINAVYAIAHGLDRLLRHDDNLQLHKPIDPNQLLAYISNTTFVDQTKNVVQFDDNGDPLPNFVVVNLQPDRPLVNRMKYKIVGQWRFIGNDSSKMKLDIKNQDVIWNGWTYTVPSSTCNHLCYPGEEIIYLSLKSGCCWRCRSCSDGFYSNKTDATNCLKCQLGFKTDENRTMCLPLPLEYFDWDNPIAIIITTLTTFGLSLNVLFLIIIIWNRKHEFVVARDKTYYSVIWICVNASFALCFMYIGPPTDARCTIQPIYLSLNNTLIFLMMASRIITLMFKGYQDEKIEYSCVMKYLQTWQSRYFIVFIIVCCQVIILSVWTFTSPEVTVKNYKYFDRILFGCSREFKSSIPAAVAIIFVITLCLFTTFLSFKIRSLPYFNHEAKYINFGLLCILLGWLAFIPSYFATLGIGHICLICFSTIINSNALQWFIVYPPVYEIFLKPYFHKYRRSYSFSSQIRHN